MNGLGVIFDVDGVLVDSYRAHFQSWQTMARRHGLHMTEEQFAATFGRTSREIIPSLWPGRVEPSRVAQLDEEKEAIYREVLRRDFPEMDGAGELLADLRGAGFALAVGSSGPPANVELVLDCLGPHLFDAGVSGADVTRGKPDPEVFLKAAGKLDLPPGRCAVIEDAPAGIEAARRAGAGAIALTGTASREKLAHADLVVDSLRELSPRTIELLIRGRKPPRPDNPEKGNGP